MQTQCCTIEATGPKYFLFAKDFEKNIVEPMGIEPTTVCLQGNLATLDHATPYKLSGDERARTAVQLKYQNTFYMLIQLIDFGFPTLN